jgi:hypothetical protein
MSAVGKELPPNSDDEAAESPGPSGFSAKGNSAWKRLRMCVRKLVDLANGFNAISGSVMTIITIATAFGIFRVVLGNQHQSTPGRASASVSPRHQKLISYRANSNACEHSIV